MSLRAGTSKCSAAWIRLSAACWAVSNPFCFGPGAACKERPTKQTMEIAEANKKILGETVMADFDLMDFAFTNSFAYLRCPPPPGRLAAPAPPLGRLAAPAPPPGRFPAPAPPLLGRLAAPAPAPPGRLA